MRLERVGHMTLYLLVLDEVAIVKEWIDSHKRVRVSIHCNFSLGDIGSSVSKRQQIIWD